MPFTEHDHLVEALPADGADEPFHVGILPGCARGGEDLADPHPLDSPHELLAVDRVAIPKEILRRGLLGKALDDLPGRPDGRGVVRHVNVEEFAAVVTKHYEDEEQPERQRRHEEEVDGDRVSKMAGQKGPPCRGGARRGATHVFGHSQLGDRVAEQSEFRLDAAPAPGGVLPRHPSDQLAQRGIEPRAADRGGLRLPAPVELEALAVPGEHRGRLHDDETGSPVRPHPRQPHPEDPIPAREPGSGHGALQDGQLMSQRQILEGDGRRPEEPGTEDGPETDHDKH